MAKSIKKAGIMTLYYKTYNYGAQLQAYALQRVVEQMGYECEQICYKWFNADIENFYSNQLGNIDRFREFAFNIPHSKQVYSPETIHEAVSEYDVFICGSDQIWGVQYSMPPYIVPHMALSFVPESKVKLAYGASMGGAALTANQIKPIKYWASKLDMISVREYSAIKTISEITGKTAACVLDPTLLLESPEWEDVADTRGNDADYIFVYNIGNDTELDKSAKELSQKLVCPIRAISYNERDTAGPREFLGLIRNAKYVLTNSFHGTVFSVIFRKQFYTFPVDEIQSGFSKNTRILDLLKLLGIESRFVSKADELDYAALIKYDVIEKIICQERKNSLDFLKNALAINKKPALTVVTEKVCCGNGVSTPVCQQSGIDFDADVSPPTWRDYIRAISVDHTAREIYYESKLCDNDYFYNILKRNHYAEIKRSSIYVKMLKYQMYGCMLDDEPTLNGQAIIYGAGKIGRVAAECSDSKVLCFADRSDKLTTAAGLPVYSIDSPKLKELIDGIGEFTFVITPVWDYEDIFQSIKLRFPSANVVSIEKVVEKLWE